MRRISRCLRARRAHPRRRAHARCARGIEHVHVEADVDRAAWRPGRGTRPCAARSRRAPVRRATRPCSRGSRARHDALRVGRTADADMPGGRRIDQPFLGDVGELGRGVVLVGSGRRHRSRCASRCAGPPVLVLLGDGARYRHSHRAVAADGDGHGAGLRRCGRRLLGALECIDDAARRELDVAAIDDTERGDRIEVGVSRVEPADQRATASVPNPDRRARRSRMLVPQSNGAPGWPR